MVSRICSLAAATTLFLVSACDGSTVALKLVTPRSEFDREIATELAAQFGRESAIEISLTGDPRDERGALDAILAGEADLALVSNALPYRAGIATVIPLYPSVLHVGYTGDRNADNVPALLNGARVFAGTEGSASRMIFEEAMERYLVPPDSYTYVDPTDAGQPVDVFVVFAPIAPDRLRAWQQRMKIRLVSNGSPDDIGRGSRVDAAALLNPYLRPFVIPVGTYGEATPEAVVTMAVDQVLVARSDLSEATVYRLISELLRLRPALAASRPGLFADLTGDFDASQSTFVLHAGAQAYLERSEPSVYERYSGVAEVAVTTLIALISALLGGMRLYRMKRKNRIDAFYSDVLTLRREAERATNAEARSKLAGNLRALQDRAFGDLVHEKLAADESFRIFITLSNDVLRQLGAIAPNGRHSDE